MSIPKSHYFEARPAVASRPRTVHLRLADMELDLESDRGVFGSKGGDLGTLVLLREAPAAPATGDLLDLGCGYGPIAVTLARPAPGARGCAPGASRGGSASLQRPGTRAIGQRVWNLHPDGGLTGDGISPLSVIGARSFSTIGSGTGIELSRALVYGCWGRS